MNTHKGNYNSFSTYELQNIHLPNAERLMKEQEEIVDTIKEILKERGVKIN